MGRDQRNPSKIEDRDLFKWGQGGVGRRPSKVGTPQVGRALTEDDDDPQHEYDRGQGHPHSLHRGIV